MHKGGGGIENRDWVQRTSPPASRLEAASVDTYPSDERDKTGRPVCVCARVCVYVCMRSPEFQNCKFFNSRGRGGDVDVGSPGKYLRLTYTNIAGDEGCVFKNLHRYILIKVS